MTGLDMNAPAPLGAAGTVAELDTPHPDDLAARQARLAKAMCQTFFHQLKLINAVMIELPLGWFVARTVRETMPDEPAKLCETTVIELAPAPTIESTPTPMPVPTDPWGKEDAPVPRIEASEMLPARRKLRKGKTGRSKSKA